MKPAKAVLFIVSLVFFIVSVCFFVYLEEYYEPSEKSDELDGFIIDENELTNIIQSRIKSENSMLSSIVFNSTELIHDEKTSSWYYSSCSEKLCVDSDVNILMKNNSVNVGFVCPDISDYAIKENIPIKVVEYNDKFYFCENIYISTLPFISIVDSLSDSSAFLSIIGTDNKDKYLVKYKIRGATTRKYPKKSYKITFDNPISLLGMKDGSDWLLYAAYNDQEKVRNVFSTEIWNNSCSNDSELVPDNGTEFEYAELFLNGSYTGLYALGYSSDSERLGLSKNDDLFKKYSWNSGGELISGICNTFEIKCGNIYSRIHLKNYYQILINSNDSEKIKEISDIGNNIDIFLFYCLIQGCDNIGENNLKNTYLCLKDYENGKLKAVYIPWDMDISWGNNWSKSGKNYTLPYSLGANENYIMMLNPIPYLEKLCDTEIDKLIFERYMNLRADKWSEEYLLNMIDGYENDIFLSGAYKREKERWPDGSYVDGEENLEKFRQFVVERLFYMDEFVNAEYN